MKPTRALLVKVPNKLSIVSDDEFYEIYCLFCKFVGLVQYIDECKEAVGFQAVIYCANSLSAALAKLALQGHSIWDDDCRLEI